MVSVRDLVPVLQIAIGPVILISGVGLLLLTMTNRLGRMIDRSRQLSRALADATDADRARITSQIAILVVRGRLLRLSITCAALSVLLASILIIALFLVALFRWEGAAFLVALFTTSMAALILSMVLFVRDINLSLAALKLELGGDWSVPLARADPGKS